MKIVNYDKRNSSMNELYPLLTSRQLQEAAEKFYEELVRALSNQPSSLPTILNPITKLSPSAGFGVVVAIGGTNGYASAFRISNQEKLTFFNRDFFVLPQQTSKNKLFHLITKHVLHVAKGRRKIFPIGIGFAYPLKPVLTHTYVDGELMYMTKGRNIEGLVGKRVGQEYHKFLKKEYGFDTNVAVANDAICLLLGGDGAELAGVVGTGLNFAYWESREKIAPLKLNELNSFSQKEIAINIESKNFNKFQTTQLGHVVDRESDDIGFSLAEKEAAGAYLYKIFNAGKKEIIGLDFPDIVSSDQLNEIVTNAFVYPKNLNANNKQMAKLFGERIFHRSAQIVAIQLSGIFMKIEKTKGIVPVVMEGGIFWKAQNYPSLVNLYVNKILPNAIPSFARLFGSSRRGIAILAQSSHHL